MAVQTIETLKEKFKSGSFPTQQDYHDVFDSFLSKGESLTTDDIKGTGDSSELSLTQILASLDIPTVPEGLDEFIEKVNSFLEDTDVADETINKWKEIESFLTGITDTETLTGLLTDLKAEILAEIPEQKNYTAGEGIEISEDGVISATGTSSNKKFCEIIDDLDASDAEVGTIAMYGGPTNDKYTHGFIYEKGEGGITIEAGAEKYYLNGQTITGYAAKTGKQVDLTDAPNKFDSWPAWGVQTYDQCKDYSNCIADEYITTEGVRFYASYTGVGNYYFAVDSDWSKYYNNFVITKNGTFTEPMSFGTGASWTPLNVMNVIN